MKIKEETKKIEIENLFEDPNIPFEYAMISARKYPEMKKQIYKQLFNRTTTSPDIELLKDEQDYEELVKDILNSGNISDKIHLVLYFEPSLIDTVFGNSKNLAKEIIKKPTMYDATFNSVTDLIQLSDYVYDEDTINTIIEGVSTLLDRYNKEMLELAKEFSPDLYERLTSQEDMDEINEQLKKRVIDEIKKKAKRKIN